MELNIRYIVTFNHDKIQTIFSRNRGANAKRMSAPAYYPIARMVSVQKAFCAAILKLALRISLDVDVITIICCYPRAFVNYLFQVL